MRNKITRRTISYVLSISFIFVFIVFCKPQNVYASYSRYVTASSLTVRKKASSKGKVKGYYKKGAKVTCYKKKGSWTKVKYGSHKYYVATRYLSTKKPATTTSSAIANYGSSSILDTIFHTVPFPREAMEQQFHGRISSREI